MQLHETCAKCGNADESALLATRGTRLCEKCVAQDTYGRFTKAFAAKGSLLKRGTSRACIALLPRSVSASSLGSSSVSTLFSAAPENALLLEFVRRFTEHNSSNGFNAFDTSGELKGASGGAVGDISGVFRESNAFFVGRPLVICLNVAVLARSPAEKDAIENDCDALRQHATFNLQLDFQCVKLETLFDESKEGTTNNETLSFDPATKLLSLTTASPNSISFSTARQTISLFSSLDAAPSTRKALLDALLLRLATHVVTTTTTQQLHSQHQKQLQHPITQTLIVPLHAAHAAAQVVSLSAIGQGFALPALLASDQQINNNLLIFRPFRDILPDEIAWSVRALKLPVFHALFDAPVFNTDARSGSVSATIQDLAESFVFDLQKEFPQSVSTVSRTAFKIQTGASHKDATAAILPSCLICANPIQPDSYKWRSTHTISSLSDIPPYPKNSPATEQPITSIKSLDQITENDNGGVREKMSEKSVKATEVLCYACQHVIRDVREPEKFALPASDWFLGDRKSLFFRESDECGYGACESGGGCCSGNGGGVDRSGEALHQQIKDFLLDD